ncbi:MAG: condensin complex subunit 2/barren [Piptocephalis tieghemiana]|nr:MAG: condensin complex subunit 2/barren [Piptocephalis tieghemiana]
MPLKSPGHHSGRTKKLGSSPSTSGGRLGEERYEEVHVPLNDDAAEKTERRRSGGSSSRRRSGLGLNAPKTRAVIGAAGDGYSEGLSGKGLLTQVLSPEELNRQYEEWMKIAADNKINANNTWDVALIDVFHNMTLLREGDSINFQKASCTLDGCVKIYTSRVDSFASETGRLLSGLSDANRQESRRNRMADEDEEGDEENEDGEGDSSGRKGGKRRRARMARGDTTLEKNFDRITLKKYDLEFSVDPLFQKTSADFDEGGARGLLLNHLSTHGDLRIVFDAGDVATTLGDEPSSKSMAKNGKEEEEGDNKATNDPTVVIRHDESEEGKEGEEEEDDDGQSIRIDSETFQDPRMIKMDVSRLQQKFIPSMKAFEAGKLCAPLANFTFTTDSTFDTAFLKALLEEDAAEPEGRAEASEGIEAFFGSDHELDDLLGDGGYGEGEEGQGLLDGEMEKGLQEGARSGEGESEELNRLQGPHFTKNDLVLSMVNNTDDLCSYFDASLTKNWAGPEHWRLVRPSGNSGKEDGHGKAGGDGEGTASKAKKTKEVQLVDFSEEGEDVSTEILFTKSTATMNLPRSQLKSLGKHLLPEDLHFTTKDFFSLFLKQTVMVTSRGRRWVDDPASIVTREEAETLAQSESGWEPQEDRGMGIEGEDGMTGGYVDDMGEGDDGMSTQPSSSNGPGVSEDGNFTAADNSRFFHEDDEVDDFAELVAETRKVKPIQISFAKTAKRVDVRLLKENIWSEMSKKKGSFSGDLDQARKEEGEEEEEEDRLQGDQEFTKVIGSLKHVYPERKMKDISVSFCFICLLHLANENNLDIEGMPDMANLMIRQ